LDKKIAILRGINVGGKRKVLMADLKALFKELGFVDIATYIQSGNVLFRSAEEISNLKLSSQIENAISTKYAFDVPVIVRGEFELEETIANNPFFQENEPDIERLHVTFLSERPLEENRIKAEACHYEPDRFVINGKDVFVFCAGKYHESKLTNNFFEKKLKVTATTRNWKTTLKLLELVRQLP